MGSEEGGALVTVTGVGFGNKQLTPQVPQRAVWAIWVEASIGPMKLFFKGFFGDMFRTPKIPGKTSCFTRIWVFPKMVVPPFHTPK